MDQYQQKKQLERLLVDYFRQEYPEFPPGKLNESESPDFILKINQKYSIGIELTRLYPESMQQMHEDQIQSGIQDELINNIQNRIEKKYDLKCFCKFLFKDEFPLMPEKILSLSVRIPHLILKNINNLKQGNFRKILLEKGLPSEIKSILILTHQKLTYSIWEHSNNLGIPNNLLEDIHFSIRKKDEKMKLYLKQNMNEYWLLITTDKLRQINQINTTNLILSSKFNSRFNKVFILELITGKVIVLV